MRRRDVLCASAGALALPAVARRARAQADPYRPLGRVGVAGGKEAVVGDDGTTVYLATTDGFAVVDVRTPTDPTLLAERRGILSGKKNGPLADIHDVKVDGDRLVVVGPTDPQRGDVLQGVASYDVSDPTDPTLVSFYGTDFPIHNSFVLDGVAYLTGNDGDRNPLVMVDVSGSNPREVGRWSILEYDPAWGRVNPWLRTLHDVWVQDGVAYIAHWDAGTWIADVSDPSSVEYRGHFGDYVPADLTGLSDGQIRNEGYELPGNAHYVTVNDDATVLGVGEEAWDLDPTDGRHGGPGSIALWDVRDPSAPEKLSTIAPPPTPDPTLDGVWTTPHNFELVGDRLYSSWYQGGVKLFDVSDPTSPRELAWWREPDRPSFWTARRAQHCFVASSWQDGGKTSGAALYTFPVRAGRQADPPSLEPTTTRTRTAGTTEPSTTTPGTTTTATETESGTATETTATSGQAGFGVGAALAGTALGAWRYLRK